MNQMTRPDPICKLCFKPIVGIPAFSYHVPYHVDCYMSPPRAVCGYCKKPLTDEIPIIIYQIDTIHITCYKEMKKKYVLVY